MREIRLSGSEGGGTGNRASLPLSRLAMGEQRKTWMAGPSPAMTMGQDQGLVLGATRQSPS